MSKTVAFAALGPDLEALATSRVPHAPWLLLVDPETGALEAVENPGASAASHPGAHTAKALVRREIAALVGHVMGPHPVQALARAGVTIHEGVEGLPVREVLARYRAGRLRALTEEEVLAAHAAHGRHGHHHGHDDGHHHH